MRFCLALSLSASFLLLGGAGVANAQEVVYEQRGQDDVVLQGAVPTGEVQMSDGREIVFGRVEEYKPGDELDIALDRGGNREFDLKDDDILATLPASLAKGDIVALDIYERGDQTFVTVSPRTGTYIRTDEMLGPGYTFTGRVKEFDPGDELDIELRNRDEVEFDLDDDDLTVNIPASIREGDAVDVTLRRSGDHEFVTVVPHGAAVTVGPAPGVATRTESYIGRVLEYDPGDELQVILDDGSNIEFDLNADNVISRISPNITADSAVRVTVSEQLGNRYITAEPYFAAD